MHYRRDTGCAVRRPACGAAYMAIVAAIDEASLLRAARGPEEPRTPPTAAGLRAGFSTGAMIPSTPTVMTPDPAGLDLAWASPLLGRRGFETGSKAPPGPTMMVSGSRDCACGTPDSRTTTLPPLAALETTMRRAPEAASGDAWALLAMGLDWDAREPSGKTEMTLLLPRAGLERIDARGGTRFMTERRFAVFDGAPFPRDALPAWPNPSAGSASPASSSRVEAVGSVASNSRFTRRDMWCARAWRGSLRSLDRRSASLPPRRRTPIGFTPAIGPRAMSCTRGRSSVALKFASASICSLR